ncbi:hypothetical protein R3P38DRAFT_3365468 [Favolaschia claudopus]|uniref:Uncharacterized protein n=1 Tax=Favolaschia claudopus TaxID=2862362 RepID=A0AAW0AGP8_9AGAR
MNPVLPTGHRRSAGKGFTWPPSVPEYVRSWASATGFATLQSNPRTIAMPHSVFSWFTATGSTEFPDPQYKTISFIDADAQTPQTGYAPTTTALSNDLPDPPATFSPSSQSPSPSVLPPPAQSTSTGTEYPSPSSSSTLRSPTASATVAVNSRGRDEAGSIAAGIIAALVFIAICAGAFRYYKRRQRAKEQRESFGETGTFLKL